MENLNDSADYSYTCNDSYCLRYDSFNELYGSYKLPYNLSVCLTLACFCICSIVGVVGNGLVIWIAGLKMKTVSAVWFTNLAIVDCMFCISLPLRVTQSFLINNDHVLIIVLTDFVMLSVNSAVSAVFLTVISIDRCVTVMWPFRVKIHRTRRAAAICSVFVWTVPLAIWVIIKASLNEVEFHFGYLTTLFFDDIPKFSAILPHLNNSSYLLFVRNFITFVVFLLIIFVCYGQIILKLRSNTRNRPKRFQKTFRIIVAVVICFFAGWFPYNVWPLIARTETVPQILAYHIVSNVCLCMASISCCINPVLYVLIGRKGGTNSKKSIKARIEKNLLY